MKNYIFEDSITNEKLSKILSTITGLSSSQLEKKHLSPIAVSKDKLTKKEKDKIIEVLELMKSEL
ncbi:hypothetical protein [Empedobacter falsenii]|nr:hypothetical protein [Flavobacteriaceae bacterium]